MGVNLDEAIEKNKDQLKVIEEQEKDKRSMDSLNQ